ncbi:MAG: peptidase [Pseudomonadota bacterium]
MPKLREPIQISKPGRHVASGGTQVVTFSDKPGEPFSLVDVAAVYDPALHQAPLVVGHPQTDDPAYGWVTGLSFAEGVLQVEDVEQLNAEFADLVNGGAFKKVSASFFLPDSPNHPKPGTLYLKHVGFLGAAAPAVKGLKSVSFAGDGQGTITIEFADDLGWTLSSALRAVGRMARGIREYIIERDGKETADRVVEGWDLDRLAELAGDAEPAPAHATFSENNPEDGPMPLTEEQIKAREADLAKRETALAGREEAVRTKEAQFADIEAKHRRADNEHLLDQLIKDGRFVATQRDQVLAFMDGLDHATATIDFADADGKTVKVSPLDAYREQLKKSPKVVEFGEIAGADKAAATIDFACAPGSLADQDRLALHQRALAFQAKNPGTDYIAAVKAVGGN